MCPQNIQNTWSKLCPFLNSCLVGPAEFISQKKKKESRTFSQQKLKCNTTLLCNCRPIKLPKVMKTSKKL